MPAMRLGQASRRRRYDRSRQRSSRYGPGPAAADFLDHRAIVPLALAPSHAGFEHVGVDIEQRQVLVCPPGLLLDQVDVLEVLRDAAFRGEVALHHFRTFDVHDLGPGGRCARNSQESRGIEADPLGKNQAFGQRQAIEPENEIDGELRAPCVAGLADVKTSRKHRAQHRLGRGSDLGITSDQADAFAAAYLSARPRDRRLQESQAAIAGPLEEGCDAIGVAGARAKHERAGALPRLPQNLPLDDMLHLVGAEHRNDDGIAILCDLGGRAGRPAAESGQRAVLFGIDIEAGDLEAGREQTMGQCLPQQAGADEFRRAFSLHHPSGAMPRSCTRRMSAIPREQQKSRVGKTVQIARRVGTAPRRFCPRVEDATRRAHPTNYPPVWQLGVTVEGFRARQHTKECAPPSLR